MGGRKVLVGFWDGWVERFRANDGNGNRKAATWAAFRNWYYDPGIKLSLFATLRRQYFCHLFRGMNRQARFLEILLIAGNDGFGSDMTGGFVNHRIFEIVKIQGQG